MEKGNLIRLTTNFQKDILIDKQTIHNLMTIMENTFLLRQWSSHHWAFLKMFAICQEWLRFRKKNNIYPAHRNWLRPDNIKNIAEVEYKHTTSNLQKIPSIQIQEIPYSTRQYFQNLISLKIPRCSIFILATSKWEMHKIDVFKFDHSLDISEKKLTIILLHPCFSTEQKSWLSFANVQWEKKKKQLRKVHVI